MAGLRHGRLTCIRAAFGAARAGFQRRHRRGLHRLKANPRRVRTDFAESIWREFLDPYDGELDDRLTHSSHSFLDGALSNVNPNGISSTLTWTSPEGVHLQDSPSSKIPGLLVQVASWAPPGLEASDVDMLPVSEAWPLAQDSGPEVGGRTPRCPQGLEDARRSQEERGSRAAGPWLPPAEAPDPSRHWRGRAKASRRPPRLGTERDRVPKLSLLKRKLELLLAEPEKNKRKKQHAA
ncbi:uncharacterized protein [Dasypus novemcinctus]|nr:uncharacterized protein LOC101443321 isoform X2 [Dasypus novemcinctus]XP_058147526.1 uncharacterized protein LOC101443321 isoform X2 [Dasypus novemcinctus]XP_058147532.1 uncharacterized protein LOC101443321 isoform X2 [Dasypus novemcinctus]